jgi:hypothetical protein
MKLTLCASTKTPSREPGDNNSDIYENRQPECFPQSIESIGCLEAAIGIEPMNKGFAVRPGPLSLTIIGPYLLIFL